MQTQTQLPPLHAPTPSLLWSAHVAMHDAVQVVESQVL